MRAGAYAPGCALGGQHPQSWEPSKSAPRAQPISRWPAEAFGRAHREHWPAVLAPVSTGPALTTVRQRGGSPALTLSPPNNGVPPPEIPKFRLAISQCPGGPH